MELAFVAVLYLGCHDMNQAISANELSGMISSIYDCALDPVLWPSTLRMLSDNLYFATATIQLLGIPNVQPIVNYHWGIDSSWQGQMANYAVDAVEQWGGIDRIRNYPVKEPQILSRVNPQGLTCASRHYVEIERPRGIIDRMAVPLVRDEISIGAITFGRDRSVGAIRDTEIQAGRLLAPHLKRALAISRLLDAKSVRATTCEAVLDAISTGVLLVAADMRLVHANRAAEAILRSGDPLRLRAGKISGAAGIVAALSVAVACSTARDGMARQGLGVPARGANGTEHVMHVLPLHADTTRTVLPGAAAAIFIATASAPRPAPIDAVAALFDLTPAEARVLDRVATGLTIPEVAQALGIAVSTVRTHLMRLFEKTRTSSQSELIALTTAFALPLR